MNSFLFFLKNGYFFTNYNIILPIHKKTVSIFVEKITMSKLISKLGINPLLQSALNDLKISVATEIQEQVIPLILQQKEDIVALAKTGTGKTAAFGLPLLQMVDVENDSLQTLILSPTRELSQQRSEEHTSELQSRPHLVCRLLLEKKK